ncbi:MAG TPA: hypothetical protein VF101_14415 [Gaiellaceae bacterium]
MSSIARPIPAPVNRAEVERRSFAVPASWSALALSFAAAVTALTATIGPDARWLVALGRTVVGRGIPDGVPFAVAPSADWPNVPILAEVIFRGLSAALGDRGLLLAQLAAVALCLEVTRRAMRRLGATDASSALVLALLVPGALLAFAGIKAQLFSLALFPVLAALLRAEAREPSRRIWLLPPLIAIWSNLHGAALYGLVAALVYLLLDRVRRRRVESLVVAGSSIVALCATPALARTPHYYAAVASSEAARRGYGLWAPLSVHRAFDVMLIAVAVLLVGAFLRARPRVWELAVAAFLAAATIHAARSGVWLLLFVAPPAAKALRVRRTPHPALVHGLALVCFVLGALAIVRGPMTAGASDALVRRALEVAQGRPILAEPATAERVAAAGGHVWISNPLDAFRRSDQAAYLDWLQGKPAGDGLLGTARVVLVTSGSPASDRLSRDRRYRVVARSADASLFVRRA